VGIIVVRPTGGELELETFLLSCRALGRGVEHQMLTWAGETALGTDSSHVVVTVRRTPRNVPARAFFERLGRVSERVELRGAVRYRIPAGIVASLPIVPAEGWESSSEGPDHEPESRQFKAQPPY